MFTIAKPNNTERNDMHAVLISISVFICLIGVVKAGEVDGPIGAMRLNEIQYIGTHNSYHIDPDQTIDLLLLINRYQRGEKWASEKLVPALAYSPPPLQVQLAMGLRMFELDLYSDPNGGKYASPGIFKSLRANKLPPAEVYDPQGRMNEPGFKVIHMPDIDVRSTCALFIDCLKQIKVWSDANPGHFPIQLQLEPKAKRTARSAVTSDYVPVVAGEFTSKDWSNLNEEVLSVFNRSDLITPDLVRGDAPTLRAAITENGWPILSELGGRIMISLFHPGKVTDSYVNESPNLEGALFFVNVDNGSELDTIEMHNKPQKKSHLSKIRAAVASNFLVYTRADADTVEARINSTERRDKALRSGAHFVSTDYPFPDYRFSDYEVRFDNSGYVRCNPKTYRKNCPITLAH